MKEIKKIRWEEKEVKLMNKLIEEGSPRSEIRKIVNGKYNNRTNRSIDLKITNMKNQISSEKTRSQYFYSKEAIDSIKKALLTTETLSTIAKEISLQINKPYAAVLAKVHYISRQMPNRKKRKNSKSKPISIVKKELNFEPIVEQQPAEIGIEVPHGMTFEGKPKKIMLHSDHFRIYF
jgi:hypothetical protein